MSILSRDKAVYRVALCVNNIIKISNIHSGAIFLSRDLKLSRTMCEIAFTFYLFSPNITRGEDLKVGMCPSSSIQLSATGSLTVRPDTARWDVSYSYQNTLRSLDSAQTCQIKLASNETWSSVRSDKRACHYFNTINMIKSRKLFWQIDITFNWACSN